MGRRSYPCGAAQGKAGEGVDGLAGEFQPSSECPIERHQVNVDLVGELHHCRANDALGQFTDLAVRSRDVNTKSTPLRLLSVMVSNLQSLSRAVAIAPSRTVKSVGLRMVIVSPTL